MKENKIKISVNLNLNLGGNLNSNFKDTCLQGGDYCFCRKKDKAE